VTTRIRGMEAEVALGPADGLPKPCVVNASTIELLSKSRMIRHMSTLSMVKRDALDAALRFSLGLD
jgi:mRNA-degrading endonuclease toxin of MazEF toxin-antitoxin module